MCRPPPPPLEKFIPFCLPSSFKPVQYFFSPNDSNTYISYQLVPARDWSCLGFSLSQIFKTPQPHGCMILSDVLWLLFLIFLKFSLTYFISLEICRTLLQFQIKICWFQQYLATLQAFHPGVIHLQQNGFLDLDENVQVVNLQLFNFAWNFPSWFQENKDRRWVIFWCIHLLLWT